MLTLFFVSMIITTAVILGLFWFAARRLTLPEPPSNPWAPEGEPGSEPGMSPPWARPGGPLTTEAAIRSARSPLANPWGQPGQPGQPSQPGINPAREQQAFRQQPWPDSEPDLEPDLGPAAGEPDQRGHSKRDGAGAVPDEEVRIDARLVLLTTPTPGRVLLDCTLLELDLDEAGSVPMGAPFALELRLPDTGWFAVCVESMLEQWAEDGRQIHVELQPDGSEHPRVRLDDGTSRVMLELETAAGLTTS